MRIDWLVVVVAALALGSACARPDWIQQTLVTVDVTGVWQNTEGGFIKLAVTQQGSKVTGSLLVLGLQNVNRISGPIEGSVAGDVFRFKQTDGSFEGEMTASGDEMTGYGRSTAGPGKLAGTVLITLRRISASPGPISQP